jgi:hypothetical protein
VDAPASGGALYGNVSEEVGVSGSAITGVADVPAGATVKLVNATPIRRSASPVAVHDRHQPDDLR